MRCLRMMLTILALSVLAPAYSQSEKPIRFIVGYPAGAVSDTLTRMLAEELRKQLGQTVIVENRVGAAGRLSCEALKAAAPDGQTLLFAPVALVAIFPHTYKSLRYDPFVDFAPVSHIAGFQIGLAIANNVPATKLAEYVALVKRDPKFGNYGSSGAGSIPHFVGVLIGRAAGIEMTHIPYKGTAPVLTDLAGGNVSAGSLGIGDLSSLHRAGKLKVLATSGAKRSPAMPDVATFTELGLGIEGSGWFSVFTRAGSPKPLVDRYAKIFADAARGPAMQELFDKTGLDGSGTTPEELARIHRADYERWGPVIKASGFTSDD